jgi:hypothetical protein
MVAILLALGSLLSSVLHASVSCFPATFNGVHYVACLEKSGSGGSRAVQARFDSSTLKLLKDRYTEKGTIGDATSSLHLPAENAMTCTLYEPGPRGRPNFQRPVLTMRAYWETEELTLPSRAAILRAEEGGSGTPLDLTHTLELSEFATAEDTAFTLRDLKILSVPIALFERELSQGRDEVVLTTRGPDPGSSAPGPWEKLYRFMGFERLGTPFQHPRFPGWTSIAMHRPLESLRISLQALKERGMMSVATDPLPSCEASLR